MQDIALNSVENEQSIDDTSEPTFPDSGKRRSQPVNGSVWLEVLRDK